MSNENLNMSDTPCRRGTLSTDCKLNNVFETCHHQIQGTLFFLLDASEIAAKEAYEELRRCCSRKYASSEISDLRVWVFRVLYNLVYDSVGGGKNKKRRNVSNSPEPLNVGADSEKIVNLNDDVSALSRNSVLQSALMALSFDCRSIFLLRQNGSLSYEQISQATGISLERVKALMKEAILTLVSTSERYDEYLSQKNQEMIADLEETLR